MHHRLSSLTARHGVRSHADRPTMECTVTRSYRC